MPPLPPAHQAHMQAKQQGALSSQKNSSLSWWNISSPLLFCHVQAIRKGANCLEPGFSANSFAVNLRYLYNSILSEKLTFTLQTVPVEAEVQGKVPSWLHGSFVRNGPGTFRGMKHLFDGYAMLAKFAFENGTVKVSHRYSLCLIIFPQVKD